MKTIRVRYSSNDNSRFIDVALSTNRSNYYRRVEFPIKLYHGSDTKIPQPVYGFGSVKNDYGRGFYCTKDKDLACEWACKNGFAGFLNEYELDTKELRVLHLGSKKYSDIMSWLAILIENRSFSSKGVIANRAKKFLREKYLINDYRGYDVIIRYRADDSYFRFAEDFISGAITFEKLSQALFLGGLGEQVVLISEKAFSSISVVSMTRVDDGYIVQYSDRDKKARLGYRSLEEDDEGLLITDIMQRGY